MFTGEVPIVATRVGGKETFTRQDVIELLAALGAAGDLMLQDIPKHRRQKAVSNLAWTLAGEYLGEIPEEAHHEEGDGAWESDPDELEIHARSSEIEALLIESCYLQKLQVVELQLSALARSGRPAALRIYASRLRAAGTQKDIGFPSSQEIWEIARMAEVAS